MLVWLISERLVLGSQLLGLTDDDSSKVGAWLRSVECLVLGSELLGLTDDDSPKVGAWLCSVPLLGLGSYLTYGGFAV